MGSLASGLYTMASTACYVTAIINIHMLLDRGEPVSWVNFILAVVLGVAGMVLSCMAGYSAPVEASPEDLKERREAQRLADVSREQLQQYERRYRWP